MRIKLLVWASILFSFLSFLISQQTYSDTGFINDTIQCHRIEIKGENSLYVWGDLTYYVEKDQVLDATIYFCNIFNKVLARAYVKVTLKQNDDRVTFEEPINIDNESDIVAVRSTHHIRWKINAIKTIDCCADHEGIIGCDKYSGKLKCYDGEISKDCTCDKYHISE